MVFLKIIRFSMQTSKMFYILFRSYYYLLFFLKGNLSRQSFKLYLEKLIFKILKLEK